MRVPFIVWLGLSALCLSYAHAGQLEDGYDAYKAEEYSRAYALWLPLAGQGNARAQFFLSILLQQGLGVGQDAVAGRRWLEASAAQGYAPAQFNLGNSYLRGEGGGANPALAASWWRRSAEQNFPEAQYNLGRLYEIGYGVEKDHANAVRWYRRAATEGSARAGKALEALGEPLVEERESDPGDAPQTAAPGDAWIGAQPGGNYTLQLMAGTDAAAVARFVRQIESPPARVASYGFDRDGVRWHAVVWGSYESRATAREAARALPAQARKAEPWIRRFRDIHAIMIGD